MSDRQVRRVSRFVSQQIWAIREATLDVIVEVLRMRAAGISLTNEEIQARIGAVAPPTASVRSSVAVLPLYGCIAPKMNAMTAISGGTSIDAFMAKFRSYRDDPSVSAIILDIDSPGGSAYGLPEAFDEIYQSRSVKPVIGAINPECGSAALWLASACKELVCTTSGYVGSVGCFCVHEDFSKANEMLGIKPTYISYGEYKTEGNPDEPLSDEALAYMQSQVNAIGESFVKAVAKGRGTSVSKVKSDYGRGRMLMASDALAVGLIDSIATFDETLARLVGSRTRGNRVASAENAREAVDIQVHESETLLEALENAPGARQEPVTLTTATAGSTNVFYAGTVTATGFVRADALEPNEDGLCPDGYTKNDDDGLCYITPPIEMPTDPSYAKRAQADRDLVAVARS